MKMRKHKTGSGFITAYILLGVAVIVAVGVVVPIIAQTVSNASLTGIDALIAGFLTTLLLVGLLIKIVYISVGSA